MENLPIWVEYARLALLATLAIGSITTSYFAIRAFNANMRMRDFSSYIEMKKLITEVNRQVLQSEDNLKVVDDLMYARDNDGIDARQRWIVFGIFNLLEVAYRSRNHGSDAEYVKMKFNHLGSRLLVPWEDVDGKKHSRKDVYTILYYGGYDKNFIKFCTTLSSDFKEWHDGEDRKNENKAKERPRG